MLRRRRAAPNTDFGDTTSFSGYVSDSAMTVVWVPSLTTDSGYWAIGSVREDSNSLESPAEALGRAISRKVIS